MSRCCPNCSSTSTKKNGHIHNGKQNHCCKECGRQFVDNPQQILISGAKGERIRKRLQHRVVKKQRLLPNHIERFNCTLRQRVSRLVRKSLSFSKKLANHIGAIKYFICHYNLEKA